MSLTLSRRDALRGIIAMGAAAAALPSLASLSGSALAGQTQSVPVQTTGAAAVSAPVAPSLLSSISNDPEPFVLVVKNDVVRGFKGRQEVRIQDAGLVFNLKSSFEGRFR